MIHHVRYVCPKSGIEKTTQNISYRVGLSYNLHESRYKIEGMLTSNAYMVVKCECGEEHEFIVATKLENL